MQIQIINHPLLSHKLSLLRDKNTETFLFRNLINETVTLLAFEATRDIKLTKLKVETPLTSTMGLKMSNPSPIIIPVLRAGLGMLQGLANLIPMADIGFLGMSRNEVTFETITYANKVPENLEGRLCFILDPMLATGGTLVSAINCLLEKGASNIIVMNILATNEGLKYVENSFKESDISLKIFLCAIDERLNSKNYILPGLGDAGDRLFGVN